MTAPERQPYTRPARIAGQCMGSICRTGRPSMWIAAGSSHAAQSTRPNWRVSARGCRAGSVHAGALAERIWAMRRIVARGMPGAQAPHTRREPGTGNREPATRGSQP